MRAGTLKHRVRIEQATEGAADALNEKAVTWSELVTVWGAVLPQNGREFYRAQQVNADVTHLVSIRYRSDVDETNRLVVGNRTLDITSVVNVDEADKELLITCVEDK